MDVGRGARGLEFCFGVRLPDVVVRVLLVDPLQLPGLDIPPRALKAVQAKAAQLFHAIVQPPRDLAVDLGTLAAADHQLPALRIVQYPRPHEIAERVTVAADPPHAPIHRATQLEHELSIQGLSDPPALVDVQGQGGVSGVRHVVAVVHPLDQGVVPHPLRRDQALVRVFIVRVPLFPQPMKLTLDQLVRYRIVSGKVAAQGNEVIGNLAVERHAHRGHDRRQVTVGSTVAVDVGDVVVIAQQLGHQLGDV